MEVGIQTSLLSWDVIGAHTVVTLLTFPQDLVIKNNVVYDGQLW